ncbi:MAG: DUF4389 domain-containing protein [Ilumatobacteraceae bacterium]
MAQVQLDVPYNDGPRNRGTVAIRILLAIPHLIIVSVWNYAVEIVAVVHWFIQLFTGKRNQGLFNFSNRWLGYASRTYTYTGLLFDEYPGFIDDNGKTPVQYSFDYAEPVNRLTAALRLIWAIPAFVIAALLGIAGIVVTIVTWFTILITGKHPRGQFDYQLKVHRDTMQTHAYGFLLTDDYPKYA